MTTGRFPVTEKMKTLVDIARYRADEHGDKVAYTFVDDDLETTERTTFAELDAGARKIACALRDATAGQRAPRALLVFPPGLEYVRSFLGCLYAGVVAVPTYPPRGRNADIMLRIVADSGASVVLTTSELAAVARAVDLLPKELQVIASDAVSADTGKGLTLPSPDVHALAFLQYTSGSTGTPKGVMVTHENLMANEALIHRAYGTRPDDTWFTWLPMYHDMGLIGTILHPLYLGGTVYLASPMHFVQKPVRWLEALTRFRANVSGGPNFAYQLCVDRVRDGELLSLDLSAWRIAFNGAEPIQSSTISAFAKRFAKAGFRATAMRSSYGLAEATLLVACSELDSEPCVREFQREALESGTARPITEPSTGPDVASLSGYYLGESSADVVIADPVTRRRSAEGAVGEIWVKGAGVAIGYWNRPEVSAATFEATLDGDPSGVRHLRTGDLGFVLQDHLFVTGRWKDVIVVRGRNHYPQDLETAAMESDESIRPGCVAAFTMDGDGPEVRVVVVAEIARDRLKTFDAVAVRRNVRSSVARASGLVLSDVVLVGPGGVLKTSSGKIRRVECKRCWQSGELERLDVPSNEALPVCEEARTKTEDTVGAVLAAVLGEIPANLDATVFDLGADSIKMVHLAQELERVTGRKISVGAIYDAASVREIARLVESEHVAGPTIDLYAEAMLPSDVVPSADAHDPEKAEHVLLTGATGFLGAYLVAELLSRRKVQVTCIVRASDDAEATSRVLTNLLRYDLYTENDLTRLHVFAGDLAKPRFGWADERHAALSARIDAVYHGAAAVDWSLPYQLLKAANVDATVEMLRFACSGRAKPFHFISTMWVFPLGKGGDPEYPIDLETRLPRSEGLETGYNKSKWVAERLVAAGRDRGLPVTIHRMDFITAARRGSFKLTDLLPRLVRDAVNMGVLPSDDVRLDLVAVDALAKMIVMLSRSAKARGCIFHLLNHERLSMTSLARMLTEAGYQIRRIPYAEWKATVARRRESALYPLSPLLDSYDAEDLALSLRQGVDNSQATAHLEALEAGLSRAHPSMEFVVGQLLSELRRKRLIPAAEARSATSQEAE